MRYPLFIKQLHSTLKRLPLAAFLTPLELHFTRLSLPHHLQLSNINHLIDARVDFRIMSGDNHIGISAPHT